MQFTDEEFTRIWLVAALKAGTTLPTAAFHDELFRQAYQYGIARQSMESAEGLPIPLAEGLGTAVFRREVTDGMERITLTLPPEYRRAVAAADPTGR